MNIVLYMNYNDKYIHREDYKSILDENNIIYTLS